MKASGTRFAGAVLAVCVLGVSVAVVGMLCWQMEWARRVVLGLLMVFGLLLVWMWGFSSGYGACEAVSAPPLPPQEHEWWVVSAGPEGSLRLTCTMTGETGVVRHASGEELERARHAAKGLPFPWQEDWRVESNGVVSRGDAAALESERKGARHV